MLRTSLVVVCTSLAAVGGLTQPDTEQRQPAAIAAVSRTSDGPGREQMARLVIAKRFCVALRRNHQREKSSALREYIDPEYLRKHELDGGSFPVATTPVLSIHNIMVADDHDTILCLVDKSDGTELALLLRTVERDGKLFLAPESIPDRQTREFTPWILKTEL
ncbi:MAG: hypothetical protein ACYTGL_02795 [Planctomycetota bacterium]